MTSSVKEELVLPKYSGKEEIEKWIQDFNQFSETNGWEETKQYEMVYLYLDAEAKKWFSNSKEDIKDMEHFKTAILERFGSELRGESNQIKNDDDDINKLESIKIGSEISEANIDAMSYADIIEPALNDYDNFYGSVITSILYATPVYMVKKIKETAPNTLVAKPFFQLCTVAATCKSRDFIMDYQARNFKNKSFSTELETYLLANYTTHNGKFNLNQIGLIGTLVMAEIPDRASGIVDDFRKKLRARSIYDADIDKSGLSTTQKKIVKEKLAKCNKQNAKLCGRIMYNFMHRCIKNMPLPDIGFLNEKTYSLTEEQMNSFRATPQI